MIAFVNDEINEKAINTLVENGVKVIAMRCAGYNNVDIKAADKKLPLSECLPTLPCGR